MNHKLHFLITSLLLILAGSASEDCDASPLLFVTQSPYAAEASRDDRIVLRIKFFGDNTNVKIFARFTRNKWKTKKEIESKEKDNYTNEYIIDLGKFEAGKEIIYTIYALDTVENSKIWLGYDLKLKISEMSDEDVIAFDVEDSFVRLRFKKNLKILSLKLHYNLKDFEFKNLDQYSYDAELNEYTAKFPERIDHKYEFSFKYKRENENEMTHYPGAGRTFNYPVLTMMKDPKLTLVTIDGTTKEIGYNHQACLRPYWKSESDTCKCCLIKLWEHVKSDETFTSKIVEDTCLNLDFCESDIISDYGEISNLYKSSINVPELSIDQSMINEDGQLRDDKIPQVLSNAYKANKLQIGHFEEENCLVAEDILKKKGFNTLQLFNVKLTCGNQDEFILKESTSGYQEAEKLIKISRFNAIQPFIFPQITDYPSILLPISYFTYADQSMRDRLISIQPKAPGEDFCKFIKKNIHSNRDKLKKAYKRLGIQLSKLQQLLTINNEYRIAHGDLKCLNIFYDENNDHFTFIDNETMTSDVESAKSPRIDIAKILFGHFNIGEDEVITKMLDQVELSEWYRVSIGSFIKGYVTASQNSNATLNYLSQLFNGNLDSPGNKYDYENISIALKKYINPSIQSIRNELNYDYKKYLNESATLVEKSTQKGGYYPSPDFWGDQIIYSIFVDRFRNGDLSNDRNIISRTQIKAEQEGDYSDIGKFRHGGDLQGIIDRLDYIKGMGVTAIMISSLFENNTGNYHGYCVSDFLKIDPNFGSDEVFRKLIDEAHSRNIYVVLDIVVNHMCDDQTNYAAVFSRLNSRHTTCANDLDFAERKQHPAKSFNNAEINFDDKFFRFFTNQKFFNRCGENTIEETESNDPVSFYGDFDTGMFDFNTRNRDFQRLMFQLMSYWVAKFDIDGFRMDAVKHVSPEFTVHFSSKIRDYAAKLGKKNFLVAGEIAGSSKIVAAHFGDIRGEDRTVGLESRINDKDVFDNLSIYEIFVKNKSFPYPGLNSIYEFGFSGNSVKMLQNIVSPVVLNNYFKFDEYRKDITNNGDTRSSFSLLEIHDWPRFASYSPSDMYKSIFGLQYLLSSEGMPIIYYGMEQGFSGVCPESGGIDISKDKEEFLEQCNKAADVKNPNYKPVLYDEYYRQNMFLSGPWRLGSTVPSIDKLKLVREQIHSSSEYEDSYKWENDPFLNREHGVYKAASKFIAIRKSCSALRYGDTHWLFGSENKLGVFAFVRQDRFNSDNQILVIGNSNFIEESIPDIKVQSLDSYRRVDHVRDEIVNHDGVLRFDQRKIFGNSIQIFAKKNINLQWNDFLGTHLCSEQE